MSNLVSVIVPVYNAQDTIKKCISSLINQQYTNIEILLVDDGSTDNSLFICQQLQLKDSRIRIIEKLNGGVSSARNMGIEHAEGVWILFVDSDDWIDDDLIENYDHFLNEYSADVIIGGLKGYEIKKDINFQKYVPIEG